MKKIELKNLPIIRASGFISIGEACRPAYWIKKYKVRDYSLLFDWMMNYKLDLVVDALKNGIDDWFLSFEENKSVNTVNRNIMDKKTGIKSLHDFPRDAEVEDKRQEVMNKFKRRLERMRELLEENRRICFICNRNDKLSEFVIFAEKMFELYRNKKFIIINVINSEENKVIEYDVSRKLKVYEIYADDTNRFEDNTLHWQGNQYLWEDICSHLKVVINKKKKVFSFFGIRITY